MIQKIKELVVKHGQPSLSPKPHILEEEDQLYTCGMAFVYPHTYIQKYNIIKYKVKPKPPIQNEAEKAGWGSHPTETCSSSWPQNNSA